MATVTLTSGTSWTCATTGIVKVETWGGGGAGGGNSAATDGGSGGGGGAYAAALVAVTPGSYSYSIGAGGTPASGAAGGDGGDTTFNSTSVVAKGGKGGGTTSGGAPTAGGAGGLASASTGTLAKYDGGYGCTGRDNNTGRGGWGGSSGGTAAAGYYVGSSPSYVTGGNTVTYPTASTPSGGGHGGNGGLEGANGNAPASGNGGGGGGSGDDDAGSGVRTGGAGADGKIIITYFDDLKPAAGAASLAGYAPTVTITQIVSPASGAATATGYQPSINRGFVPSSRSLAINGVGPKVRIETAVNTGGGGPGLLLALGLNLESVTSPTAYPGVGALSIAGYAPTIQYLVAPGVAELLATGYAPTATITQKVEIAAADASIDGYAPTVGLSYVFVPAAGDVLVESAAPETIEQAPGDQIIYAEPGAAEATGYAPAVREYSIREVAGSVADIAGYAPSVGIGEVFAVLAGALEVSSGGLTPAIETAVNTGGGGPGLLLSLALNLGPVTSPTMRPGAGDPLISGYAPTVGLSYTFVPAAGQLSATGAACFPARSDGDQRCDVGAANAVLVGNAPTVIVGVSVTFPFATTVQGFTGTAVTGTAYSWSATGNPGGSLSARTTGSNRNNTNVWTLATDWAALGIPANCRITAISAASAQSRISEFTSGASGGSVSAVTLTPTGYAGVQIAPSRAITGLEGSWTTGTGAGTSGVEYPSGGSVTIRTGSNLRTTSGGGTKAVTCLQDNISFVVSYTASLKAVPLASEATITGYAPTVSTLLYVAPATGALAISGVGPKVRIETATDSGGGGPGLLLALGLNLEAGSDPATRYPGVGAVAVTGYAPSVFVPISARGADTVYALAATMSSSGGRVITQGDSWCRPGATSLALVGYAPTSLPTTNSYPQLTAGGCAIGGYAPSVEISYAFVPGSASLVAGGVALTPDLGSKVMYPGASSLGIDGYDPKIPENPVEKPAAGAAQIVGYAPTGAINYSLLPSSGAAAVTGYAPAVVLGSVFSPGSGSLSISGSAPAVIGTWLWNASGALSAGLASTGSDTTLTRTGSGALQAQPPLSIASTIERIVTGSGALASGPASLAGSVSTTAGVMYSGVAHAYGRGRIIRYEPPRLRQPVRVNRYTVALKPNTRTRIRRPNTRGPQR